MKMEQTECSKTSAYKIQTPGNYPEESIQHTPSCLAFPPCLCNSSAYLVLIHFFTLSESYIPPKMKVLFVKEIYRWKLDDSLPSNAQCIYTVPQWCTNPGYQVAWVPNSDMVASDICGSSVENLLHAIILASRILRWLPGFGKFVHPAVLYLILKVFTHGSSSNMNKMCVIFLLSKQVWRRKFFITITGQLTKSDGI
jgi:hypothetical protein